jgi:hypothetical protein
VIGSLLIGAAVGLAVLYLGRTQEEAKAQPAPKTIQWEYKVVYTGDWDAAEGDFDKQASQVTRGANKLGAEGWEYAGAYGRERRHVIFKRPKR